MSIDTCHLCGSFCDTDEAPEGYYVKGTDKYTCETCVEANDLEYED